jgi:isopentenyl-diphosphate delta-isomerase
MMEEQVVLVDQQDQQMGTMEKMEAHRKGLLHRAFSVFIFNSKGELLLQQRARDKYHSAGKWTNTCCSHPRPGEKTADAALRRLNEEMGLQCKLEHRFSFLYQADLENQLSEHEYDHVFFGYTDALPILNPEEAIAFRYISIRALSLELEQQPGEFTAWLKICFPKIMELKSV